MISQGSLCQVNSTGTAQARSVEIASGATLQIEEGYTLQVRTPLSHGYPNLKIDGELSVHDETSPYTASTLLLEMTSTSGVAVITGTGTLNGGPALMATGSGSNAIDHVFVDEDITVTGTWEIPLDVENDGLFLAEAGADISFLKGEPSEPDWIDISGTGAFQCDGGDIGFWCPQFDEGDPFTGSFLVDAGDMSIATVGTCPKPDISGTTVVVTSGALNCDDGFAADGATVVVAGGSLFCYGDVVLANSALTVSGTSYMFMSTATLILNDEVAVSVEDAGEIEITGDLSTGAGAGDNITITIADDGQMSCEHFTMLDTEVAVEGLFIVDETSGFQNEAGNCSFAIHTGGTWIIRWGYLGASCELNILGGTIEIPADTDSLTWTFDNGGPFLCTGGVISVEQPETLRALP